MAAPEDGRTPAWPQPTRHRRQLRNSGLIDAAAGKSGEGPPPVLSILRSRATAEDGRSSTAEGGHSKTLARFTTPIELCEASWTAPALPPSRRAIAPLRRDGGWRFMAEAKPCGIPA
jgi:hypothetical protein